MWRERNISKPEGHTEKNENSYGHKPSRSHSKLVRNLSCQLSAARKLLLHHMLSGVLHWMHLHHYRLIIFSPFTPLKVVSVKSRELQRNTGVWKSNFKDLTKHQRYHGDPYCGYRSPPRKCCHIVPHVSIDSGTKVKSVFLTAEGAVLALFTA